LRNLIALVLLAIVMSGCQPEGPPPTPPGFQANPKAEDFLGEWNGSWENIWQVRFTVSQDSTTGAISVLYEWEERLGQPLSKQTLSAQILGGALTANLFYIWLPQSSGIKARAVGRFDEPRTANISRAGAERK